MSTVKIETSICLNQKAGAGDTTYFSGFMPIAEMKSFILAVENAGMNAIGFSDLTPRVSKKTNKPIKFQDLTGFALKSK